MAVVLLKELSAMTVGAVMLIIAESSLKNKTNDRTALLTRISKAEAFITTCSSEGAVIV